MKFQEIREMATPELEKRLQESRDSLGKLRFLHGTSQVESTALLKTTRRDIARMLTVLHERRHGGNAAEQNKSGKQGAE